MLLFWFYPYSSMCVFALHTQYFPELCGKKTHTKTKAYYSSGTRTHDLCNSRTVSYYRHRDCPVARGSSNPVFGSGYCNDLIDVKIALVLGYGITDNIHRCFCKHCILSTLPSSLTIFCLEIMDIAQTMNPKCSPIF